MLGEGADTWLVTRFAVYLLKYPNLSLTYDGNVLDPANILVERETEIELDPDLGGQDGAPVLRIMEWKSEAKAIAPSLVRCDENGVALHELTDRIDSPPGVPYTAYLMWAGFPGHAHDLLLADLAHETLSPIVEAARQAIRSHLDMRLGERRAEVIERWKAERVYPYSGGKGSDAYRSPGTQGIRRGGGRGISRCR